MIDISSRLFRIRRLLLFVVLSVFSLNTFAVQPSKAQLAQIQSLSMSERVQLAKQMGVELPSLGKNENNQSFQPSVSVLPISKKESEIEGQNNYQPDKESFADSKVVQNNELTAFGYDLFAGQPTTFSPVSDIPVSSDYLLGPGDSLKLNLFGKQNRFYELSIDQEGKSHIPDLGPISLAGLTFIEAKQKLKKTIDQKMIGVKVSVSMGQLRSIRVFVLGEARVPGSYVVSSLSTMTNALVLSGGVSKLGSLRNIQLKRKGQVIQNLDLYDLLLNGDTSGDAQLKSGDVVFIPSVGPRVGIKGQIKRSASYELKGDESIAELLFYAGGLLASSYSKGATIVRVNSENEREFINLDLSKDSSLKIALRDGDLVDVPKILPGIENVIRVTGHVEREEVRRWVPQLRLSEVVTGIEYLKSDPDLNYALIKRYVQPERTLDIVSFDVSKALKYPNTDFDPVLQKQDELVFFGLYSNRSDQIREIVSELRLHASINAPSKEVSVEGSVRYPGVYPYVKGMTVSHLLDAAGGLLEKAFLSRAELNRYAFDLEQNVLQERKTIGLSDDASLNIRLNERDSLTVQTIPEWSEFKTVSLSGEVVFPGTYRLQKGDTLKSVVERAGGLTEHAYIPGALFTRMSLKQQQEEQLGLLRARLEQNIAKAELSVANYKTSLTESSVDSGISNAQSLLDKLNQTPAVGRLVIDFNKVLNDPSYEILLEDGDRLAIPPRKTSVTIIGEVQMSVSQVYREDYNYKDYISQSGGVTENADESRIYVLKADGSVINPNSSSWFASSGSDITPGDTIVVPLDADKVSQVVLWRDMSQIFYQIALGAAAVGSL